MKKVATVVFILLSISCENTYEKNRNKTTSTETQNQTTTEQAESKPILFTLDSLSVENCNTDQQIEFLGNPPKRSNFYIIGTAHSYVNTEKLQGYMYDNGGLMHKAFEKIHELQGNNNPLPLFSEGVFINKGISNVTALAKVVPPCVIDMGYKSVEGIDTREPSRNSILNPLNIKFSDIFTEYCEMRIVDSGKVMGTIKKDIPTDVFIWLRDTWYPTIISPDISLEESIISKSKESGIVVCGLRHVARMGLSGKLDWAIAAVNGGKNVLESKEEGMFSNRIMAERFVCENVLKLPCLP
ncbi:MAG: hypothetical protein NT068_04185 [Candidatus Nomurabacteria bacterium]|nr:hypothetical protein [Candidatus Nomurabacteria bacterium]